MTEVYSVKSYLFLDFPWYGVILRRRFVMGYSGDGEHLWLHDNSRHRDAWEGSWFFCTEGDEAVEMGSRCFNSNNPWGYDPAYHWTPPVFHPTDQLYVNLIWAIGKIFYKWGSLCCLVHPWPLATFSFSHSFLFWVLSPPYPFLVSPVGFCCRSFSLFSYLDSSNFYIDSLECFSVPFEIVFTLIPKIPCYLFLVSNS